MAPPISRRSKQNSPNSPPPPIPLPGIALGIFATIAAGFAASRALRRKRPAQSVQDEKQSIPASSIPLLVQEREIEIKEKDDSFNSSANLVNASGTITIAHEASKLAAGLKPVLDAFEEVSFAQKRDAKPLDEGRREEEEKKREEEDCGNGQREEAQKEEGEFEENEKKKGETMENWETSGEEGEIADITVKIEVSLIVDEASVEALHNAILEEKEEEEEEEQKEEEEEEEEAEGKGEEVDDNGAMDVDEDTGHDGDDDRSSADQHPSPVLINGRILDFFEEMPDSDLLSSGSNSLSDAFSESSMQEVSSAPVKPFVPTEETLEVSWPEAKADFFVALNQSGQENTFSEDKNWSGNEKNLLPLEDGLSEMKKKVPDFEENLSQTDQSGWAVSNNETPHLKLSEQDVDVGLLSLKPVLVEIEGKESSVDKVNQVKFGILSDVTDAKGNSIALEGEVSIKVNGLDEGIAESTTINGKVPSNGSPELDDLDSIGEGEHVVHSTREIADDFTVLTCEDEKIVESVRINGKVLLDESPNSVMTADDTSSQTGQEGTDGTISDVHGEPDLLAAIELSDNNTCVRSEDELYDDESTQEEACLGIDTSEELVIVEDILEEPVLQLAAQKLDIVDGASAENNVNAEQGQSSSFLASKGITEGNELNCDANTDNVEVSSGREDINDGLSEQTLAEGRIYAKEQEIEEITRSCDPNVLILETKKQLASSTDSAHKSYNDTREVDYLVSKGPGHQHGLQPKVGFSSEVLQYPPLEIGFICLVIALVSFVLWYLEVSPLIRS